MGFKRMIVDTGEKVANFFASDLQNHYYKYLMLHNAKKTNEGWQENADPDFIKEARCWWKEKYGLRIHPIWHCAYSYRNGIRDVRYIPENLFHAYIEPYYNRKLFAQAIDDKCFYSERFSGAKRAETLLRNVSGLFFDGQFQSLNAERAAAFLSERSEGYVIKESITGGGGNRIIFVEPGQRKTQTELLDIFVRYKKDFVVESLIRQCPELAALNPDSVNTIRFMTFLDVEGAHLLSAVMRIGDVGSHTDNYSTGGICCGITDEGKLKPVAVDHAGRQYQVHPSGRAFAGVQIPGYDRALELVLQMHRRFGHFRLLSWDIAIDELHDPVILEFNVTPQSIDIHQVNNGPLFGDRTEEILDEVFKNRAK